MKYNSSPRPPFSIETGVFVTAIDHTNVIFCFEKRDAGSDLGGGASCCLRARVWKQQVKQVILKTELLSSFCFNTFVSMN